MSSVRFLVACLSILQISSSEKSLEGEVKGQLELLEEKVYFPISIYLSGYSNHLESVITNFTNYEDETNIFTEAYLIKIQERGENIYDLFEDIGIEKQKCLRKFENSLTQILKSQASRIKILINEGIDATQNIITQARNVFSNIQNKTVEVRMATEDCLHILNDKTCLITVLQEILIRLVIFPEMIKELGDQHDIQLNLVEEDIIGELEKTLILVNESGLIKLDEFFTCLLDF